MGKFTGYRKAEILSILTKITEDDKDKFKVYHDIYNVLKDCCSCRIPDDKVLPEWEDLVRFLKKTMMDHRKPPSS
jgi:hypothetical protein